MRQTFEGSVASYVPKAEIVFDRFHLSKHLSEGVDKVRREEHYELMKEGDDRFKGMRCHFLFNAEKLDQERQEELNALQKLRTSRAWGIKDYFRWFWDEPDAITGREFFDHRCT
jgi:transposase